MKFQRCLRLTLVMLPTAALLLSSGAGLAAESASEDAWRREVEEGRRHWAFQKPVAPAVPAVRDAAWPRGDIDRFLLAAMEEAGVKPVADAGREALLRRLAFDLTGLPPTPAEVREFVADDSSTAVERVVDRLLASPRFGELTCPPVRYQFLS